MTIALSGTNLTYAHQFNRRIVLETVRLHGPLSRADISRYTALTAQTVSNIVDKLLEEGVVTPTGRRTGARGQPAVEIGLNPDGGYAIGLHLDRDHLTGVLVDLAGGVRRRFYREWSFPTPAEAVPELVSVTQRLCLDGGIGLESLWGLGVCVPGPIETRTGRVTAPPNFPGWENAPLRDLLTAQLDLPTYLDTDATSAAVGERWFGAGREVEDFLYVYFSVGLGGGLILNGRPYRGPHSTAGMFGHLPVDPDGARCACGGIGCLELYASLASLYEALARAGIRAHAPSDLEWLLHGGDPVLLGWIEQAAARMARGLVIVENLLNPQAILFGGRLPDALLDRLLEELSRRLPDIRTRGVGDRLPLLKAEAAEDDAALGAATMPLFEALTPGQEVLAKAAVK